MTWNLIATVMLTLMPVRQNNVPRLREYVIIAVTIENTCREDEWCDSVMLSVSYFETGFVIKARGELGEVGPWQLLNVSPYMRLSQQCKEAWRRWNVQGPAGYTGEAGRAKHPLADHRKLQAEVILAVWGKHPLELSPEIIAEQKEPNS